MSRTLMSLVMASIIILSLVKTNPAQAAEPLDVVVGQDITYTVTVSTVSGTPEAGNFSLTCPSYITLTGLSGDRGDAQFNAKGGSITNFLYSSSNPLIATVKLKVKEGLFKGDAVQLFNMTLIDSVTGQVTSKAMNGKSATGIAPVFTLVPDIIEASVGDSIEYTLTIENQGDTVWSTDVGGNTVIKIAQPPHTVWEGPVGLGPDESITMNAPYEYIVDVGDIAAGADKEVKFKLKVADTAYSGLTLATSASVAGITLVEAVPVTVKGAEPIITIVSDKTLVKEGDTIEYTVLLENVGDDDWTPQNAVLTLSEYLTYGASTDPEVGTPSGPTIPLTYGSIAAGATKEIKFTATVNMGATTGQLVKSVLHIANPNYVMPLVRLVDTENVTLVATDGAAPIIVGTGIDAVIESDRDEVMPGEVITYSIVVGNGKVMGQDSVMGQQSYSNTMVDYSSSTGNVTDEGTHLDITFGTIAACSVAVLTTTFTVKADAVPGTDVESTLTVTGVGDMGVDLVIEDPDPPKVVADTSKPTPVFTKTANVDIVSPEGYITYTLEASNLSGETWFNVVGTDVLDANVEYVSHSTSDFVSLMNVSNTLTLGFGDIPAGTSKSIDIKVQVLDGTGIGTLIANTASIVGNGGIKPPDATDPRSPEVVDSLEAIPNINKTSNLDEVELGGILIYDIEAYNTGNDTWAGAILNDTLPATLEYVSYFSEDTVSVDAAGNALTLNYGDILAGGSKTISVVCRVVSGGIGDYITNTAEDSEGLVSGADMSPPQIAADSSPGTSVVATVSKESDVDEVIEGENIIYEIIAENDGDEVWGNVIGIDMLPDTVQYVGSLSSDGVTVQNKAGNLTLGFGDIGISESKSVTITVKAKEGEIGNTVTNSVTLFGVNEAATAVDPSPPTIMPDGFGQVITKTSNVSIVSAGDIFTYAIELRNYEPDDWTNVILTDELPKELTYVNSSSPDGLIVENIDGILTVDAGDFSMGERKSINLVVKLKAGVEVGTEIINEAEAEGDNETYTYGLDEDPPVVGASAFEPLPEVTKVANKTTVGRREQYSYLISVGNRGTSDWINVNATDELPAGISYVSFSSEDGVDVVDNEGTLSMDFGDVAIDETKTVTIVVVVDNNASGTITNTVEVVGDNALASATDSVLPRVRTSSSQDYDSDYSYSGGGGGGGGGASLSSSDETDKDSADASLGFTTTNQYDDVLGRVRQNNNPYFSLEIYDESPALSELDKSNSITYMYGYPDGTIRGGKTVSRAEAAAMFYRLIPNNVKGNTTKGTLGDIGPDDWFFDDVGAMIGMNLLSGYPDGTFRPNSGMTRAEFVTLAAKFDKMYMTRGTAFSDMPEGHWANQYVNSAYLKQWVIGYGDFSFRPDQQVTRAEAAKIINMMVNRSFSSSSYGNRSFSDLSPSDWSYRYLMDASMGQN